MSENTPTKSLDGARAEDTTSGKSLGEKIPQKVAMAVPPQKQGGKPLRQTRVGRDADGLTKKQATSIPIIAGAPTRHAGVTECIEAGIIGGHPYFYAFWMKDEAYTTALIAEEQRLKGLCATRKEKLLTLWHDAIISNAIKIATSDRPDAMRGVEFCAALMGYDVGRGNRIGVTVTNLQIPSDQQETFKSRIERRWLGRTDAREPSGN